MTGSLIFATFAVLVQYDVVFAQGSQVPSSLTAAELWNPYTWFYPYAIATAEGYRDYYVKAQKATNDLYKQIYATNAFPWITGVWGTPNQNQQNSNTQSTTKSPEQSSSTTQESTSSSTSSSTTSSATSSTSSSTSSSTTSSTTTAAPEETTPAAPETTQSSDVNAQAQAGDTGAGVQA